MKIEKIDMVALDKENNVVNLLILDYDEWDDPREHIDRLQDKILYYVSYVDSGRLNRDYPNVIGLDILTKIIFKHPISEQGVSYLKDVQDVLEDKDFSLAFMNFED